MMHHHAVGFNPLLRQRDCVQCPAQAPACACGAGFDCVLTSETCDACPEAQCVAQQHKSSGGVGKGAMAGAVVAVLAFLFLVVGGFLWWRRRSSKRRMAAASREKAIENVPGVTLGPGSPSPAANNNRFSRPLDAYEKAPGPVENPFESNDSIRSGGGLSAHSIPIGIASEGQLSPNAVSPTGTTFAGVPIRPARSPDLNIRATPFDGNGTLQPPRPNYAPSQRTDFTTSTMDSTASSAMEALYESPTIVTGVKRTVISAGRGEVVPVTDLNSNPNSPRGSAPLRRAGQPGPSPLAASHFSRSTLAPMLEEDPFADDGMSVRTQSTSMTNMSFGMGTPTASIRSFAQPTVASRVNVASLARSATLRSLAPSVAPSSASHQILEHPLSQDNTDAYPPTRRGSVDSFASNTDSVLASFPFVPPSPLPTSSSRSPLSVVFTPSSMNRQSNGSSMFGTERSSEDTPPPLPNTYDIAALSEGAVRTSTAGASSSTPASQPQQQQQSRPRFAGAAMMAARDSTMSSGTSGGLDDFDFQFAPASEDPTPHTSSQPQLRSDSSTLPKSEPTSLSSRPQAPPSMPAAVSEHQHQRSESRASLDLLALSRDLAANKLSYD